MLLHHGATEVLGGQTLRYADGLSESGQPVNRLHDHRAAPTGRAGGPAIYRLPVGYWRVPSARLTEATMSTRLYHDPRHLQLWLTFDWPSPTEPTPVACVECE